MGAADRGPDCGGEVDGMDSGDSKTSSGKRDSEDRCPSKPGPMVRVGDTGDVGDIGPEGVLAVGDLVAPPIPKVPRLPRRVLFLRVGVALTD